MGHRKYDDAEPIGTDADGEDLEDIEDGEDAPRSHKSKKEQAERLRAEEGETEPELIDCPQEYDEDGDTLDPTETEEAGE